MELRFCNHEDIISHKSTCYEGILTLNYIFDKVLKDDHPYFIPGTGSFKMPIEIPNFGRNNLASLFYELNFDYGAEIGVEQGEYSEVLLAENPLLRLDSIDAWEAHKGYRDHTSQEKLDRFYQTTVTRLAPFTTRSTIIKGYSMDVVKTYSNESLDFVYIDADHSFKTVTEDIFEWSKKVRKGGIVAGHDYINYGHVHVKQVLHGYTDAYKINPWFVLGREAKIEGEIRDDSRSWMFVKQ